MKSAPNLILVGPMGAGKTVVGSRLAGRLGLDFVDLDAVIAGSARTSIAELFATRGEAAFRELERLALAEALARPGQPIRSEEQTSELQSLMRTSYAVFCLKKKNTHQKITT